MYYLKVIFQNVFTNLTEGKDIHLLFAMWSDLMSLCAERDPMGMVLDLWGTPGCSEPGGCDFPRMQGRLASSGPSFCMPPASPAFSPRSGEQLTMLVSLALEEDTVSSRLWFYFPNQLSGEAGGAFSPEPTPASHSACCLHLASGAQVRLPEQVSKDGTLWFL